MTMTQKRLLAPVIGLSLVVMLTTACAALGGAAVGAGSQRRAQPGLELGLSAGRRRNGDQQRRSKSEHA